MATACRFCGCKVLKGPKCINCLKIFHLSCIKALRLEQISDSEVVCCDKKKHNDFNPLHHVLGDHESDNEGTTANNDNNNQTLINFLKSEDFSDILKKAVDQATTDLKSEISKVQTEVNNLKLSNIELVRFLSKGFTVKAVQPIRTKFAGPCAQSSIPVYRRDGPKPTNYY